MRGEVTIERKGGQLQVVVRILTPKLGGWGVIGDKEVSSIAHPVGDLRAANAKRDRCMEAFALVGMNAEVKSGVKLR